MPDPSPARPRFSVVVPTHRRNDLLARCLDRLAPGAQTLPAAAYEVIVADDGPGGENARAMARECYPWVRWVAGPRRGPAANRNRGAAEARGDWLVFTDDDCLPTPGWLAGYAARLDAASSGDGPAPRVLEGRTTAGNARGYGPFLSVPSNLHGGYLWSCNFAIERRLFGELEGFDENFPFPHLEDVDLRARLEERGERFPFVPAAEVEHPPRPVPPVGRLVRLQESCFYIARKQGVPVSAHNVHPAAYARRWVHALRHCRNGRERLAVTAYWAAVVFLVACRAPFWWRQYRRRKPGA